MRNFLTGDHTKLISFDAYLSRRQSRGKSRKIDRVLGCIVDLPFAALLLLLLSKNIYLSPASHTKIRECLRRLDQPQKLPSCMTQHDYC